MFLRSMMPARRPSFAAAIAAFCPPGPDPITKTTKSYILPVIRRGHGIWKPPGGQVMSATARILVLGGTAFAGRAIVEDALRSGAGVTLFGRGKTEADLFPGVTRLRGDRDTGDYAALRDSAWTRQWTSAATCPGTSARQWTRWATRPRGTCSLPATPCTRTQVCGRARTRASRAGHPIVRLLTAMIMS